MKKGLLMAFAGVLSMFGAVTASAENFELTPKAVTTISGDFADECQYGAQETAWRINHGKVSGTAFGVGTEGQSSVALVQFDASAYKNQEITRVVVEFHSKCTVSGKNSQIHVAYLNQDPDLTTATWTSVNALGATITDFYTSDEWVKEAGADLTAVLTDYYTADEDKVITLGFFTGTAREQEISDIKLTLYTGEQTKYAYTVNATNPNGDVLKELAAGQEVDGTALTVAYPKYLADAEKNLYTKGVTSKEYNYKFTVKSADQVENLAYNAVEGATDIVYLCEGEDIEGAKVFSDGNAAVRASNSKTGYNDEQDLTLTTLPAGKYKIVAGLFDAAKTTDLTLNFAVGENVIFAATASGVNLTEQTSDEIELKAASNTIVLKAGGGTSQKSLDYVYIQKTGDVVAAEPVIATINFNDSTYAVSSGSGDNAVTDGDITRNTTFTAGDLTLTVSTSTASTPNRFWGTNNGPQLRVYGGKVVFEVPEGKAITAIEINQAKWGAENKFNGVVATEKGKWEGNSTNVVLDVKANTQINRIDVTIADADEATTTYVNEVADIATLKGEPAGFEAKLTLTDAKITRWGPDSWDDSFVEDATGGIIIDYGLRETLAGAATGKALNGYIMVALEKDYNGNFKLKKSENTTAEGITMTDTEIAPAETTLSDVLKNKMDGAYKYITMKDLGFKTVNVNAYSKEYYLTAGNDSIVIFNNFGVFPMDMPDFEKFNSISGFVMLDYNSNLAFVPSEYDAAVKPAVVAQNIAEVKKLANETKVKLMLNDAVVTVAEASMWGEKYIIIEDATAAITVGTNSWEPGLIEETFDKEGRKVNGYLYCVYRDEYGSKSVSAYDSTEISKIDTAMAEVVPTETTLAELNTKAADMEMRLVKIGKSSMKEVGYGLYLFQGNDSIEIYDRFSKVAVDEEWNPVIYDKVETVTGFICEVSADEDGNAIYAFIPTGDGFIEDKGEADAISGVSAGRELSGDVYSVNGVKVRKAGESLEGLAKGLYIVNGKKVVVK